MRKTLFGRLLIRTLVIAAALAVNAVMLAGCSTDSAAEVKVTEDLESLRYVELDPDVEAELEEVLSSSGREYYEMFLGKAGEFDYEITECEETDSGVTAHVRITTYDFGSEYLRSWSDFLEDYESGKKDDSQYDSSKLYEMLFRNLSIIQKKEYIGYADISCVQDETGSWQTDAKENVSVRNAILGGMLEEIRILADV